MAQVAKLHKFDGLVTSVGNPAFGSARSMKNCIRHRHRGWLEQPDPYGLKFADGLPTNDAAKKISNLVIKDIHNFSVTEHGGANITVVVGTYRKTSRYNDGVYIDRSGIWMRPYWSGTAWIDAWIELTECEILSLTALSGVSTLEFANAGFPIDHFKNWVVVFEDYSQSQDHDNYLLVESSNASSVTYFGANTNLTRSTNAKMILVRSFLMKEMPCSIASQIYSLLHEIRFTSGISSLDISLLGKYATKTWGWNTTDKSVDRLIVDIGALDIWRYAGLVELNALVRDDDPVPAGEYSLKLAVVTDDNQISNLRLSSADETALQLISTVDNGINADSKILGYGDHFYCFVDGTAPAHLKKILKSDLSVVDTLEIADFQTDYMLGALIGNKLYASGLAVSTCAALIYEINLDTFATSNNKEYAVGQRFNELTTDGTNLYASDITSGSLSIYQINTTSLVVTTYYNDPSSSYTSYELISLADDIYALRVSGSSHWYVDHYQFNPDHTALTVTGCLDLGDFPYSTWYYTTHNQNIFIVFSHATTSKIVSIDTSNGVVALSKLRSITGTIYGITNSGITLFCVLNSNKILSRISFSTLEEESTVTLANVTNGQLFFSDGYLYTVKEKILQTGVIIYCSGTTRIDIKALISASALPVRARYLRVYMNCIAEASWNRILNIDLYDTAITWDSTAYFDTAAKHFYHRSGVISIKGSDITAVGAEATVDIGRSITDTGIVRYKTGTLVGYKTYVGNVLVGSDRHANRIFHNVASGDGNQEVDVFTFDADHTIDVEYSDGDEIVGLAPLVERILCLKKRSIVLVNKESSGEYSRNVVTQGVGCCSAESIVVFDDVSYWADYNGLHSISPRDGLKLLNAEWVEDWKALSVEQKEATQSVIDRVNKLWIVNAGGQQWIYDLQDGQWMQMLLLDVPIRMVPDVPGTIDCLTASKLETLNKSGADRYDGKNILFHWESNKLAILDEQQGYGYDVLIVGIVVEYESSVPLKLEMFLNDSLTAFMTETLSSSFTIMTLQAPFGARCKSPRLRFSGETIGAGQSWKVKKCNVYYDLLTAGGDMVSQ